MALELKAISRVVDGQTHIHKTDLVLETQLLLIIKSLMVMK